MKTILEAVEPKLNLNCHEVEINFREFDVERGMQFEVRILNDVGLCVDRRLEWLGGADWQKWPAQTPEEDEEYIREKVVAVRMQLVRKPKAKEPKV